MSLQPLCVRIIPAFDDNYIYALCDPAAGEVAIIDPGDPLPADAFFEKSGLKPGHIWITHHHHDHIGGVDFLRRKYGSFVAASASDRNRVGSAGLYLSEGDSFDFAGRKVLVLETPGHTLGAISFFLPEEGMLFCGDTLFSMGCGRMFEGTPRMFWESLLKIRSLPGSTRVYCTHEYTQENIRFALSITPENKFLLKYQEVVRRKRKAGEVTLPVMLRDEISGNPFLRADQSEIQSALGMPGCPAYEVFGRLRAMKDHF